MFAIDHSDPLPIYAQLDRAIRLAVATGKLRRGEQLPTVRQTSPSICGSTRTRWRRFTPSSALRRESCRPRGVGTFIEDLGTEAVSLFERRRGFAALADEFLTKSVVLGFTQQEAIEVINTRDSKHRRREKSNG